MTRGLTPPNLAAAESLHVRPLWFVLLSFDTGTLRLHNGVGSYSWGGNSWLGVGALGSIQPIEEGVDLSPYSVSMQLFALDPTVLAEAEGEPVFNRSVVIYQGFLADDGQLVATPQVLWSGYGDHTTIELGGEQDLVSLTAESELRFLDQANGRRFTDEDQQTEFSGDVALEYLPQMIDAQIVWGPGGQYTRFGAPPTRPGAPPPPTRPGLR